MKYHHIILSITAAAALALAGCSSTPAASPTDTTQASSVSTGGVTQCTYPAFGQAAKPVQPPSGTDVPNTGEVTFTMNMQAGQVVMTFDRAGAPCAVHSFESLASQGFYDNTDCPRLAPGFVLQCGDPTGTKTGGPGYSFPDELSGSETYPRGTVAMANAGPDTNGSQFFIVLADANLPASYDVLGTVDDASMKVIDAIAAAGVDPSDPKGEKPMWGAHINTVTSS